MADAVTAELRELGLEVEEDGSAAETGSDAGNLLARLPGPEGSPWLLLCAHLDTVPLAAPVEVERTDDGVFRNRNDGILGADNKAAVATILGAVRRFAASGPPVGVELLFTTCEELALGGAKAFHRDRLQSRLGYVFDHASPVGELIVGAPSYYRVAASFSGVAAHAGIRPEDGRNAIAAAARAIAAMPLGRVDDATTANVGTIAGGSATNVVADSCHVELETRSLDEGRASEMVQRLVDAASEAAADSECDLGTSVERLFSAYRLPRTAPAVELAAEALRSLGIEPFFRTTGGGSDANALIAGDLPTVNVANGTQGNHQPDESVSAAALELMLDVTLALIGEGARWASSG